MKTSLQGGGRPVWVLGIVLLLVCVGTGPLASQEVVFENPRQSGRTKKLLRGYVEKVQVWGSLQTIVDGVKSQNENPPEPSEVRRQDRSWRSGSPPPGLMTSLATNICGKDLQALLSARSGYAAAFVMDSSGTVVCLASEIDGYSMANEPFFLGSFNDGNGVSFVGRKHRHRVLDFQVIEISVPVIDGTETIGVLTAVRLLAGSG